MHRAFLAFAATVTLFSLFAPTAQATQLRTLPGIAPHIADQLAEVDPSEPLPFHLREYLQNERTGR